MIEKAVLDVLARATEIGLPEHAATLSIIYDPFVRPTIRRRVEAAIADARTRTTREGDHILRLAFLLAHPAKPAIADPNDERGIERAFDELAQPYLPPKPKAIDGGAYRGGGVKLEPSELVAALPKRSWPITRAVAATVTLVVAGLTALIAGPYLMPTPYERFAKTPLGTALGDSLTHYVAASDESAKTVAKQEFAAPKVQKQLGSAAPALARVLDEHEKATADTFAPLEAAINEADRAFAAGHIPAHLHAWTNSGSTWVLGYWVEERSLDSVDGKPFPVVRVRRLDRLNFEDRALWKSNLEDDVIIAMPKMEEILVQNFLPALGQGKSLLPQADGAGPLMALARAAADAIRPEIARILKIDEHKAANLAAVITARNANLDQLAGYSWGLHATSQLWLNPTELHSALAAEAQGNVAVTGFASGALRSNTEMKLVAAPLLPLLAEITRWQEEAFVGRLAVEHDTTPPLSPDLAGWDQTITATLAGELAILARPQRLPATSLWLSLLPLYSFDRDGRSVGSAHQAVLRHLLVAAGIDPHGRNAFATEFVAATTKLFQLPPAQLQAAAGRAYSELFGHPVPTFTRQTQ